MQLLNEGRKIPPLVVTHPTLQDKRMIITLWQEVFQDSYEFIDLFLNRVYKPENSFVIKRNSAILSMLHTIPYDVKLDDGIVSAAYIYGVCTNPSEQGKKLMKELMNKTLCELKSRGYQLAIVIPAEYSLFNYYWKSGFTCSIFRKEQKYSMSWHHRSKINETGPYTFEACTIRHFPCFNRWQNEHARTVIHSEYDFQTILHDFKLDGSAYVAVQNNIPVGMAFVRKESGDTVLIKEILSDNNDIYDALVNHTFKLFDAENVIVESCPTKPYRYSKLETYGLIYNLDKQKIDKQGFHKYLNMSLMLD